MKYFIVNQEEHPENGITFEDFSEKKKYTFTKEEAEKINNVTSMGINANKYAVYPDLMLEPVLIVSERLKQLIEMYEYRVIYKTVVFADRNTKEQTLYRIAVPDMVEGLSGKTEYQKNGWIKKPVLDHRVVGERNIFWLKIGNEWALVVSLDLAESILKRRMIGIRFEELEVE